MPRPFTYSALCSSCFLPSFCLRSEVPPRGYLINAYPLYGVCTC